MIKYDTKDNIENLFEPGSNGSVLKNIPGIKDVETMNEIEIELLEYTEKKLYNELTDDFQFTAKFIYDIHKLWLGKVYDWAGKPRTVMISKAGFPFCAPEYIEREMKRFETDELAKYTPCSFETIDEIAEAIAVVHAEFEIIHPFREGNGRIGRLISVLMAYQSGFAVEKMDEIIKSRWDEYVGGIHSALKKDYSILIGIFSDILKLESDEYRA
jgi:cell filamentation protein